MCRNKNLFCNSVPSGQHLLASVFRARAMEHDPGHAARLLSRLQQLEADCRATLPQLINAGCSRRRRTAQASRMPCPRPRCRCRNAPPCSPRLEARNPWGFSLSINKKYQSLVINLNIGYIRILSVVEQNFKQNLGEKTHCARKWTYIFSSNHIT